MHTEQTNCIWKYMHQFLLNIISTLAKSCSFLRSVLSLALLIVKDTDWTQLLLMPPLSCHCSTHGRFTAQSNKWVTSACVQPGLTTWSHWNRVSPIACRRSVTIPAKFIYQFWQQPHHPYYDQCCKKCFGPLRLGWLWYYPAPLLQRKNVTFDPQTNSSVALDRHMLFLY